MATILLAWEFGAGMGHLMTLRPIADGLVRRGHRVIAVLQDLSQAQESFSASRTDRSSGTAQTTGIAAD